MSTEFITPFDALADAEGQDGKASNTGHIHLRVQQRNGRKSVTTMEGLPSEYDPKKMLKFFKKEFACNGSLIENEDLGPIIQLQGDQRQKIFAVLIEDGFEKDMIKVHGT